MYELIVKLCAEEFLKDLLFFVLGVLVTHWYDKKNTKDQKRLFNKISADVRDAILSNPNDTLRHDELLEILEELRYGPIDTGRLQGPIDGGNF